MALVALVMITFFWGGIAIAQNGDAPATDGSAGLLLSEAVMCEDIETYAPVNRAVVFATGIGQVVCFTAFENIPEQMFIYHSWFRGDELITTKRLTLKPPKWGTHSKILLRQADIGPWRVEVHDQQENIITTLRFSITE